MLAQDPASFIRTYDFGSRGAFFIGFVFISGTGAPWRTRQRPTHTDTGTDKDGDQGTDTVQGCCLMKCNTPGPASSVPIQDGVIRRVQPIRSLPSFFWFIVLRSLRVEVPFAASSGSGGSSSSSSGSGPDQLHTFHCTPCLPGSSLVCGQGEWKVNLGPLMFKTGSIRIASSVALRLG